MTRSRTAHLWNFQDKDQAEPAEGSKQSQTEKAEVKTKVINEYDFTLFIPLPISVNGLSKEQKGK